MPPTPTPKPSATPQPGTTGGFRASLANAQAQAGGSSSPLPTAAPTPGPAPAPMTGQPVNPAFNPGVFPNDAAGQAAYEINAAQGGAGSYAGYTGTQTAANAVATPPETTNAGAGQPHNPNDHTHVLPPPPGFMPDYEGATTGWVWNPTFSQYQRVEWNAKTFQWDALTKFQQGPPTDNTGHILPGLPTTGGLDGRGTTVFPIATGGAPTLPSYLSPSMGNMSGQPVPFSTSGIPMTTGGAIGGQVASSAPGGPQTAPTQIEVRSPTGGYGIGVDTASTLAAYNMSPSGDPVRDQALTLAALSRRSELEASGVPSGVAIEIVRNEMASSAGQRASISNVASYPAFAGGGQMTVARPTMMVDMQTGRPRGVFGEGGPETATFTPHNGGAPNPNLGGRYPGGTGGNSNAPEAYPSYNLTPEGILDVSSAYRTPMSGGMGGFNPLDPMSRLKSQLANALREGHWALALQLQQLLGTGGTVPVSTGVPATAGWSHDTVPNAPGFATPRLPQTYAPVM